MKITINTFKLAPYQEAFLYNHHRFTTVQASTKAGKTAAGIQWAVEQWHDFRFPVGWETTWCAPVYEQAKIAYKRIKRTLPRQYDVNESTLTCYTPRGDELRFKTADKIDHLYGPDARAIVMEEFTRMRDLMDVFMALRSTLTKTRGKMKLIGNYIGSANAGNQLALSHANDPEWAHFIVTASDAVKAGILDPKEVEQARKDLPHPDFMALYMCEGSAHPLQMMQADAINDLWTNEVEHGEAWITVDVARFGRDKTIVGVWDGLYLAEIIDYTKQDLVTTAAAIDNLAKFSKIGRSRIIIDDGGVGGGVVDILKGCVPFNGAAKAIDVAGKAQNFGNLRSQCYFTLADHVNDRMLAINPECSAYRVDLSMELEAIRRLEDMAEGKLKVVPKDDIKEALGRSPDVADMLMMRMLGELRGVTGSTVSHHARRGKDFKRAAYRAELVRRFGG